MCAVGFTLIFGVRIINLAHGAFYGAYGVYTLTAVANLSLSLSVLAVAAFGVVMERLLVRPLASPTTSSGPDDYACGRPHEVGGLCHFQFTCSENQGPQRCSRLWAIGSKGRDSFRHGEKPMPSYTCTMSSIRLSAKQNTQLSSYASRSPSNGLFGNQPEPAHHPMPSDAPVKCT
jgi:hypothetical protein